MAELRLGRRAPKNAPALQFARLLASVTPTHPASEDYLAALPGWQVLGNDRYGDCVAVTWANVRRLVTASLGGHEVYPTLDQVITFYKTQNPAFPAEDEGMDIQTALEALVHDGGPDGVKALAFARVDHTDLEQVKAALAIFGFVWTGINVRQANMGEFNDGIPWDDVPTSPIDGGHSVIAGGYLGDAANDVRFVTWGEETGFTDAFWSHDVEEAWVVIWPEHLGDRQFLEGLNFAALAADYKAITGRDLPVPPPPMPIPPDPQGCLDTADRALFGAISAWMAARHSGTNRVAAAAARAWAAAKGLVQ